MMGRDVFREIVSLKESASISILLHDETFFLKKGMKFNGNEWLFIGQNSKIFCTIGISVKKYPEVLEFIQIGPIILVEMRAENQKIIFQTSINSQSNNPFLCKII